MARLDFANAMLAARRARIAGPPELRELLVSPSLEARTAYLRSLPLGSSLRPESAADPTESERAFLVAFRNEALAIVDAAEGTRARQLLIAFLSLEEAEAVKAILRGVARGAAIDRTLAAVPLTPGLPADALRSAASSASLDSAVDALVAAGSTVASAVRGALARARAEGLLPLEIAADRAALSRALSACRKRGEDGEILACHVADRADARNAEMLLFLAGAAPRSSPWMPGGRRFSERGLAALAERGTEDVRAAVARAFSVSAVTLWPPWRAHLAIAHALLRVLRREARRSPLSIAVPLAYLAARREEVQRVSIVLRATALELPADEILDLIGA